MTGADEKDHPGIAKIKRMWDQGQFDKIEEMVEWWEKYGDTNNRAVKWFTALENLGQLGGLLQRLVVWLGIIAGAYFAFTGHLVEWIKGIK